VSNPGGAGIIQGISEYTKWRNSGQASVVEIPVGARFGKSLKSVPPTDVEGVEASRDGQHIAATSPAGHSHSARTGIAAASRL